MRLEKIGLILSLAVAFSSRLGERYVPNSITYIIMLAWIFMAICKYISTKRNKTLVDACNVFIKGNLYNKIIIYLYTVMLIVTGMTEQRFFSTNLQTFINAISAIAIIYLFEENALGYSVFSLAIAYFVAVVMSIVSGTYFFEFHDIAFAAGFLIIYYFSGKEKLVLKDLKWALLVLIIALVAFKRIAVIALVLVVALNFILNYFAQKSQKTILNLVSACMMGGIYLFLIICANGIIQALAPELVSGRNYYYSVFNEFAEVSPTFLGLGRNAMATLFTTDYAYMKVGNIHSDVLRMYAECGFWLYLGWLVNYFCIFPYLIKKKVGFKTMRVYLLCTFYLFLTYLTDNTELYIVTQFFYILIPLHTAYKEMQEQKIEEIVNE